MWPCRSIPSWPARSIVANPIHRHQSTKYNRELFVPLWPICPIVANPTHRGQPTPSYRGELAQSCQPAPSCPTGSIQSMAATQSCLTCPIVAGPPFHGHAAPCNRGESTRDGQSTPCCPSRAIQLANPPRRGQPAPLRPTPDNAIVSMPIRVSATPAGPSQARVKPGQGQASRC